MLGLRDPQDGLFRTDDTLRYFVGEESPYGFSCVARSGMVFGQQLEVQS